MKKKKTVLLLLSLSFLTSAIGYSSWIIDYNQKYVIENKNQSIPVAYIVGKEEVKYTSIEKALDMAQSGDIVCVIPPSLDNYHPANNNVQPDQVSYEISRDCEIKEGVILVIPTDKSTFSSVSDSSSLNTFIKSMQEDDRSHGEVTSTNNGYKSSYGKYASDNEKNYLRVSVTIKEGITLKNNGTLLISGYLSGGANAGSGIRGQTSHSYSQIKLETNAKIIQNNSNATTYCFGYIKESKKDNGSEVDFKLGTIYLPLIICDYKGFQFLSGIEEAVKEQGCSPFNQIELRNIDAKAIFYYGSVVYGVTNIYVYQNAGFLGTVDETLHNTFKLLGNGTDALINLTDSNYSLLSCKFNNSSKIMNFSFIGGMKMGNLALNLTLSGQTIDLNTKYGFFPISYRMDISFNKNDNQSIASFDLSNQKIKLLPGAKLVVNEGCNLNGSSLAIFSSFIYGKNGTRSDITFGAGGSYPLKDGASLIVNSNASVTMNEIGGNVYCDNSDNISCSTNYVIVSEGWNQKQSGIQYVTKDYLQTREKLSIVPLDYQTKKKIFVGMNVFTNPDSNPSPYLPKYGIKVNENEKIFDGYQGVIFEDDLSNVNINLINNINVIKKCIQNSNGTYQIDNYEKDETITCTKNLILCALNSNVSISNNNNGVNEFEVQSITVSSLTNKVDGKDPLYIDGNIYLQASIEDINKSYDKTIIWSSSDESIASIDSNGKVTGISLGQVTLYATCGGVTSSYQTEVISDSSKIGVTDAWIVDTNGNSSKSVTGSVTSVDRPSGYTGSQYSTWSYHGKYSSNNGTTLFSLKYSPDNAIISKVTWTFKGSTKNYLLDYDGNKDDDQILVDDGSLSVTIKWDGYTNTTPDGAVLKCTILDITGNETIVEFFILHDSGVDLCIVEGTKIMLSDGSEKNVEDLKEEDKLMVYDHYQGKVSSSSLFFNYHSNENNIVTSDILTLLFSDDTTIKIHVDHGFFDVNLDKYVYINNSNVNKYIGHKFIKINSNHSVKEITLTKYIIRKETIRVYSPVSVMHLNIVTNGLLSITGDIYGCFNIFECNKIKFDPIKMKEDIDKYGLFKYEDLSKYMRKEVFDLLPIRYFRISIRKGITTKKKIIDIFEKYLSDK